MRFAEAVAVFESREAASTFDIPLQIDPDSPAFAVRFRVLRRASEVRACEAAAEESIRAYDTARFDADVPERVRSLIPSGKRDRVDVAGFIGKLQHTQVGVVAVTMNDDGEVATRELTEERVEDADWLWLAENQAWNWTYVRQQWSQLQVLQRDSSLVAEVDDVGKPSGSPNSSAGESEPPCASGGDSQEN